MDPQLGLSLDVEHTAAPPVGLADRFIVPPFTVLDTRAGYWQDRQRGWQGLGIKSELGREGHLAFNTVTALDPQFDDKKNAVSQRLGREVGTQEFLEKHYDGMKEGAAPSIANTGTSVFDPVLCEIAYRWFSPSGGRVLDPFAGGSVRGIVAAILGRRYTGVDLRGDQVTANYQNASEVVGPDSPFDFGRILPVPRWVEGDATQLRAADLPAKVDLIFTCPPYADLEVYSDDPSDLSNMPYATFRAMLAASMAQSVERLEDDRFAVWVVGEARDQRTGASYGIVRDTVTAGLDAGLMLWNELVLLNNVGSGAMRAAKQTLTSRKMVRMHQHVLVFVKGDGKRAAAACGTPEVGADR